MSKKQDDLEAIVDLLHEWCVEYGEGYVYASIVNGAGMGGNDYRAADHQEVDVYRIYEKDPGGCNR